MRNGMKFLLMNAGEHWIFKKESESFCEQYGIHIEHMHSKQN